MKAISKHLLSLFVAVVLASCSDISKEGIPRFDIPKYPGPERVSMNMFSGTLVSSLLKDTLVYDTGNIKSEKGPFHYREYSYDSNGYLTHIRVKNDYPFHHLFYYQLGNDTIHVEFEKLDFQGKVESRKPYGYYLVDSGLITEEVVFESGNNIQYFYDDKSRLVEKLYRFKSREIERKISYRYVDNSQYLESILDEYGQDTLELRRYKNGILDQIDADGLEIAYERLCE